MSCHICGKPGDGAETIEKCKLCCDGVEQEFCSECSLTHWNLRAKFGTPEANALFQVLRARRESWRKGGAA